MKSVMITSALVAYATAHGMVRSIQGANGVEMPGLTGTYIQFMTRPGPD